jgi:inner membrane protein
MTIVVATSLYLLGTVGNKVYINSVFKNTFAKHEIKYDRYKTVPLPLTNFLWMGIAETENGYYTGLFSIFDKEKPNDLVYIPRNDGKLQAISNDADLKKLIRFTKGYYHVNEDEGGLYLADLRFGKSGVDENADYIFKFYIRELGSELIFEQADRSRNIDGEAFSDFINRIKGI